MKKFFTLLVLAACCAAMTWGCSDDKYDDTEIRQEIENLKQEIASMKEQVNSLKTIIDALNENKFITNYTEAADGSCTITFNDGKTITLHNGKDGAAAPAMLDDRRTRGRDRAFVHLYPDRNGNQKDRFHRNGYHRRTRNDPLEVHHAHQ